MDLSTPQRFNKRSREKSPPDNKNKNKILKTRVETKSNVIENESEDENGGNEDIFNNEVMENPSDENEDLNGDLREDTDESVQFKMLAQRKTPCFSDPDRFNMPAKRGTPGPSVEDKDEAARSLMPAERRTPWGVAALILPVGQARGGPGCFVPSIRVHKVPWRE